MPQTPTNNQPQNSVELSETEFREVYSLLKMCLAAEMGVDEKSVPDGDPFISSCHRILTAGTMQEGKKKHDMSRGFVPLFERLHNARNSPVKTNDGLVYRVEFR